MKQMGGFLVNDALWISFTMYKRYYNKIGILNQTVMYKKELNALNGVIKSHIRILRHFHNSNVYSYFRLRPKQNISKLIRQKLIYGICNITYYLSYKKSCKPKKTDVLYKKKLLTYNQEMYDLYKVLDEFISYDGALIYKDKIIHKYIKTKSGSSWALKLQDIIIK